MEISIFRDNKKVFDYKSKKSFLEEQAKKILICQSLSNLVILSAVIVSNATKLPIREVIIPVVEVCSVPTLALGEASDMIIEIFTELVKFAKIVLIGIVVVNTIIKVGEIVWKNTGNKLSYEEIFSILLKNLAVLSIGLGIDTICWWLFRLFGGAA